MFHQWHTREPPRASLPAKPSMRPVRFRDASPAEQDQLLDLAAQSPWPNGASFSDACQRYYEEYGVPPNDSWSRMQVWIRVASLSEIVSLKPPADAGGDLRDTPDCKGNRSSFWRSGIQNVSLGSNGDPSHNWGVIRVKGYERWACCGQPADHPGCWKGRVKYQMDLYDLAPGFSSGAFWGLVNAQDWDGLRNLWLQEPQRGSMWLHWNQYEQWHQTIIRGKVSLADGIVDKFQNGANLNALDQATLKMILDLQNRWNAAMCMGGGDSYVLFPPAPAGILRPPPAPAAPKVFFTTPIPTTWDEEIAQVIQVAKQFTNSIATNQFTAYLDALQKMNQLEKDAKPFIQSFPRIKARFVFSPTVNAEFRDCVNETLRDESAFNCPTIDFFPRYQEMRKWVNQLMNPPQVIQADPNYEEIFFWKDFNPEFLWEYYVAKTVNDANWLDEINQESKRKLQEYDPQPLFAEFEKLYADMDTLTEDLKKSHNDVLPAIRALYAQRGYMTKERRVELETIYDNLEFERAQRIDETKAALVKEIAETKSLIHADFAQIDEMMTQFQVIKDAKAIRDELERIRDTYPLLADYESFKGVSDVEYPTKDQLVQLRRAYADLELRKDNLRERAGNHTDLKEIVDSIVKLGDEEDKVVEFDKLERLYEDLKPRLRNVDDFSTIENARAAIVEAFKAKYHAEFAILNGLGLGDWDAIEAELKRIEETYPTKDEYKGPGFPTRLELAQFNLLKQELEDQAIRRAELYEIVLDMNFVNQKQILDDFKKADIRDRRTQIDNIMRELERPFCFEKPDIVIDTSLPYKEFEEQIISAAQTIAVFVAQCQEFDQIKANALALLTEVGLEELMNQFDGVTLLNEAKDVFKKLSDAAEREKLLEETGDSEVLVTPSSNLDSFRPIEEWREVLEDETISANDDVSSLRDRLDERRAEMTRLVEQLETEYGATVPELAQARAFLLEDSKLAEIDNLAITVAQKYPPRIWKETLRNEFEESGNEEKRREFERMAPTMTMNQYRSFELWLETVWSIGNDWQKLDLNEIVTKFRDQALEYGPDWRNLYEFAQFLDKNRDTNLLKCNVEFRLMVGELNGQESAFVLKYDFSSIKKCIEGRIGLWVARTVNEAKETLNDEMEQLNPKFYAFLGAILYSGLPESELEKYLQRESGKLIQSLKPDEALLREAQYGFRKLTTNQDDLVKLLENDAELFEDQLQDVRAVLEDHDLIEEDNIFNDAYGFNLDRVQRMFDALKNGASYEEASALYYLEKEIWRFSFPSTINSYEKDLFEPIVAKAKATGNEGLVNMMQLIAVHPNSDRLATEKTPGSCMRYIQDFLESINGTPYETIDYENDENVQRIEECLEFGYRNIEKFDDIFDESKGIPDRERETLKRIVREIGLKEQRDCQDQGYCTVMSEIKV